MSTWFSSYWLAIWTMHPYQVCSISDLSMAEFAWDWQVRPKASVYLFLILLSSWFHCFMCISFLKNEKLCSFDIHSEKSIVSRNGLWTLPIISARADTIMKVMIYSWIPHNDLSFGEFWNQFDCMVARSTYPDILLYQNWGSNCWGDQPERYC